MSWITQKKKAIGQRFKYPWKRSLTTSFCRHAIWYRGAEEQVSSIWTLSLHEKPYSCTASVNSWQSNTLFQKKLYLACFSITTYPVSSIELVSKTSSAKSMKSNTSSTTIILVPKVPPMQSFEHFSSVWKHIP